MKITICGSIIFYKDMESIKDELLGLGFEVKMPELAFEAPSELGGARKIYFVNYIDENGGIDAFPAGHEIWNLKQKAIQDHFRKIEWADAILVVNNEKRGIKGYVGGNTIVQVGVAAYLNKPIFILNDISSELPYKQEILGMKPIILKGNLELIKKINS